MSLRYIDDRELIVDGREYWAFRLIISDAYIYSKGSTTEITKVVVEPDSYGNKAFYVETPGTDSSLPKKHKLFNIYSMILDNNISWKNHCYWYVCETKEDAIMTWNAVLEKCLNSLEKKKNLLTKEIIHFE